jgi:hypothetical protein
MIGPARVLVIGPLAPFARGFAATLAGLGYSRGSVESHGQLLAHVSRWLASQRLDVGDLTPDVVERFLQERRRQGYASKLTRRGVTPLLHYLSVLSPRGTGTRRTRTSRSPVSPCDVDASAQSARPGTAPGLRSTQQTQGAGLAGANGAGRHGEERRDPHAAGPAFAVVSGVAEAPGQRC